MSNGENRLGYDRISGLLTEARELAGFYDAENRRSPRGYYNYGSVEDIALRLFERGSDVIIVGVTLRGDHVNVHVREGSLDSSGGLVYADLTTETYVLEDLTRADVARFGTALCNTVIRRATNGHPEVRQLMPSDTVNKTTLTRRTLEPYLR